MDAKQPHNDKSKALHSMNARTQRVRALSYSFWSSSEGTYRAIFSNGHCNMRHRSFSVVVVTGRFFRSLSKVEDEIWWSLIKVYVVSPDERSVSQNGV